MNHAVNNQDTSNEQGFLHLKSDDFDVIAEENYPYVDSVVSIGDSAYEVALSKTHIDI
jgi:hypothetical protein